MQHVTEVLQRLKEHQLFVKLEKCQFHVPVVDFLGYCLTLEGVCLDPAKVQSVVSWQEPKTKKDLQQLLGFANYYCKFELAYSRLKVPLVDCLRGKKSFQWTADAQQAFEQLKTMFSSEEYLAHGDPHWPLVVETDASDRAVGAVLLQEDQNGNLQPCAFHFRKLTPS
uniref:uncharacterized protein LOC114589402 n=1 Tax=Podarcis muralis TaxID=64176 RepID=UPI00109FF60A|nr:uncharacterized protein LOC114589402 [Podarcis muralis]